MTVVRDDRPALRGEMTITTTLTDANGGVEALPSFPCSILSRLRGHLLFGGAWPRRPPINADRWAEDAVGLCEWRSACAFARGGAPHTVFRSTCACAPPFGSHSAPGAS